MYCNNILCVALKYTKQYMKIRNIKIKIFVLRKETKMNINENNLKKQQQHFEAAASQ